MKNILAFAGSNGKNSINNALVKGVVARIERAHCKHVNLTDWDVPMYSLDLENDEGIPLAIQLLKNEIAAVDGLIISVNEHNGMVSAYFKNMLDWLSRADRNFLKDKKVLLMSTSPGARGAKGALEYVRVTLPRFGANVVEHFSFPSFKENFDVATSQITNETLSRGLEEVLASFLQELGAV